MPAQRRKVLRQQKKKSNFQKNYSKSGSRYRYYLLFISAIFAVLLYFLFLKTNYWNSNDKLTVAVQESTGDVSVFILDVPKGGLTQIRIPGSAEVEVADNLGLWKLKSVWELGKQENKAGSLLAETLTRHFKFPVFAWAGPGFLKLAEGRPSGILQTNNSNLSLGDKLKIFFYVLNVKNTNREVIELTDSNILKKTKLKDGEEGYILSGFETPGIFAEFSDYSFTEKIIRVQMINASGNNGIVENTGDILEVLGAKVSAITKAEEEEIFCEISGRENMKDAVSKVEQLLGCRETNYENGGNFDLILKIGGKFK